MNVMTMIASHPQAAEIDDSLAACLAACLDCAGACTICADACLSEDTVDELVACIRLDLICADICLATAAVVARPGGGGDDLARRMIETCAEACRLCAEECERHARMHDHCRICAEACRACEDACRRATLA
jgi:hypothetical protein